MKRWARSLWVPVIEMDGSRSMYPLCYIGGHMAITGPWDEAYCLSDDDEDTAGWLYCYAGTPEEPHVRLAPESLAFCRMLRDGGWKYVSLDEPMPHATAESTELSPGVFLAIPKHVRRRLV